jgi:hypothetical protein
MLSKSEIGTRPTFVRHRRYVFFAAKVRIRGRAALAR